MTLSAHEQTRKDLDRADAIIRACWDNFKATEPTFVLRDLIVIELAKAREEARGVRAVAGGAEMKYGTKVCMKCGHPRSEGAPKDGQMTLDEALLILATVYTQDDDAAGYAVHAYPMAEYRGIPTSRWLIAWRVVREHLHMQVEPK